MRGVSSAATSAPHGRMPPNNDAKHRKTMDRSLVAVVFVGAFLGYLLANAANSFFVPTWLLALGGGGIGGYTGGFG